MGIFDKLKELRHEHVERKESEKRQRSTERQAYQEEYSKHRVEAVRARARADARRDAQKASVHVGALARAKDLMGKVQDYSHRVNRNMAHNPLLQGPEERRRSERRRKRRG